MVVGLVTDADCSSSLARAAFVDATAWRSLPGSIRTTNRVGVYWVLSLRRS